MSPGGATRCFAVLGDPITHTLSPAMHNAALAELGLDAVYLAFRVAPERLMGVLPMLAELGFGGVNLTIPHKVVAFEGLERLDDSARMLGAANTVAFDGRGMVGYNTDGVGFLRAVEEAFGEGVTGRSMFLAGTGGAGRAVALAAARAGAGVLVLWNRSAAKAEVLAEEISALGRGQEVRVVVDKAAARDCDLVVNGTSVGMHAGDAPLLGGACFREGQWVMDLIYVERVTAFMRPALENGAKAVNGLGMLLHQGAEALKIWTGQDAPVAVMRAALERAVYR